MFTSRWEYMLRRTYSLERTVRAHFKFRRAVQRLLEAQGEAPHVRPLRRFFKTPEGLAQNKELCTRHYYIALVHQLPEEGMKWDNLRFTDFKKSTYAPFVI